ncbi:MAG: YhbY family RNA-binding protein [Oscillospiraceae bacterium]|nr:YhbY family RNA-binding protein [Oscillospiraceae bacterium]
MLTSKQRAKLRSIAQSYDPIFYIGKQGISDEIINQLENAINARELIKLGVQESCEYTAREAADAIAPRLNADTVAVIGRKFVLWRRSKDPKKRVIELD